MRAVVVSLVAVLAASALALLLRREAAPEETALAPNAAPTQVESAPPESQPTTARIGSRASVPMPNLDPEAPADVAAPASTGSLTGKLVWDQTWQPGADLEVRLTTCWLNSFATPLEDRPFLRSRTDPLLLPTATGTDTAGRFRLDGVPQDRTAFLVVRADGVILEIAKLENLPEPGRSVDVGEIVLPQRGTVVGTIPRENAARVRIVDDPLFENALLAPEEHARMLGVASEFAPELFGVGENPRTQDHSLAFPEARTDGAGRFAVRGVRPGLAWLVLARGGSVIGKRRILVEAGKVTDLGVVTFPPTDARRTRKDRCQIVAVDEHYAETAAQIQCENRFGVRTDWLAPGWVSDVAAADVRAVRIRRGANLPSEPASIEVEATPGEEGDDRGSPARGSRSGRVIVRVAPAAEVTIRVLDAAGKPAADARVRLHRGDAGPISKATLLPDRFQPAQQKPGVHTAPRLPRVRTWAVVTRPAQTPIVRELDLAAQRSLVLEVRPRESFDLDLECVDGEGHAVGGAEIWVASLGIASAPARVGRTDASGRLVVKDTWASGTFFAALHPAFAPSPSRAIGEDRTLRIVMQRNSHLTGVVTERGERVAATWMVLARPSEALAASYDHSPFLEPRIAPTDVRGNYAFHGLVPGSWTVTAAHPRAPVREIDLAQLDRSDVPIELEPVALHACSGHVSVDGIDGAGLIVRLAARDGAAVQMAQRVARDGSFAFPEFPQVACTLTIERVPTHATPTTLFVRDLTGPPRGETIAVRTGSATLSVLGVDRRPLAATEVKLVQVVARGNETGLAWTVVTDARGIARVQGLPEGTYRVVTEAYEGLRRPPQVTVLAGRNVDATTPDSR